MRRNLKQVILWGLAILAIPLFVLAATTSKKINSSGYTKDQGYFPIATTGIASFQDPASVGNYPATIHGYPYSSPNLADPQYERILVTDKWIPRATWTTTYITEPRIICTRGYNGTSAKECVPNKSVSIKFKTNYNTLTNTPNPTSTLTPVPPTATDTPNNTQTLVLTAVVATTSPTLTCTVTPHFEGRIFANGIYSSGLGAGESVSSTTHKFMEYYPNTFGKSLWRIGSTAFSDALQIFTGNNTDTGIGLYFSNTSKEVHDVDQGMHILHYQDVELPGNGHVEAFSVNNHADTDKIFSVNVEAEPTQTQTPGYNDRKGLMCHNLPINYLPTPSENDQSANKAYVDAYYNAIATPAYRYDTVATPVVAIATAFPAVQTALTPCIAVATAFPAIATHDVMRSATDPTTLLAAKYGEIVQNAAGTTVLIAVGVPTYSWLQLKP